MAAMAVAAAAITNNEEKMRCHSDGINVDVGLEFVIIEFRSLIYLLWDKNETGLLTIAQSSCQSFSAKILFLPPG